MERGEGFTAAGSQACHATLPGRPGSPSYSNAINAGYDLFHVFSFKAEFLLLWWPLAFSPSDFERRTKDEMDFCHQPLFTREGAQGCGAASASAWSGPPLLRALWGTQNFLLVFQHRETQPETGTGHDLSAKYSMESMCLHAMGFLSSHHLLVQQMCIDQVLCGTSCNFSTESKPFSHFLKQLWPSERNALWRLLLSQLVALG